MKEWGDAKTNIFEHVVLSFLVFSLSLFWDHFVHLCGAANINLVSHPETHPFAIGQGQIIVMVLSAFHFIRKLNEFRYYGSLIPKGLRDMVKNEI